MGSKSGLVFRRSGLPHFLIFAATAILLAGLSGFSHGQTGGGAAAGETTTSGSGRRGTRNFRQGQDSEQGSESAAEAEARLDEEGPYSQSIDACMEAWDPGTQMTRQEWRRSCERTLRKRPTDVLGP